VRAASSAAAALAASAAHSARRISQLSGSASGSAVAASSSSAASSSAARAQRSADAAPPVLALTGAAAPAAAVASALLLPSDSSGADAAAVSAPRALERTSAEPAVPLSPLAPSTLTAAVAALLAVSDASIAASLEASLLRSAACAPSLVAPVEQPAQVVQLEEQLRAQAGARSISSAAAEVARNAEAASRHFAQPAAAARPPPHSDAAESAVAYERAAMRVRPSSRLALALVLLAAVLIAGVVRQRYVDSIDAPTERVDLPLAHPQRQSVQELPQAMASSTSSAMNCSAGGCDEAEESGAVRTPLQPGGARAMSEIEAGEAGDLVIASSSPLLPSCRADEAPNLATLHCSRHWRRQSRALEDAALLVSLGDQGSGALSSAHDALARALGGQPLLSVIDPSFRRQAVCGG